MLLIWLLLCVGLGLVDRCVYGICAVDFGLLGSCDFDYCGLWFKLMVWFVWLRLVAVLVGLLPREVWFDLVIVGCWLGGLGLVLWVLNGGVGCLRCVVVYV